MKESNHLSKYLGLGIFIGVVVGSVFGVFFDNIPMGVSAGIIGGVEAKLNEFPWQVRILVESENADAFQCGGSIIGNYKYRESDWWIFSVHPTNRKVH